MKLFRVLLLGLPLMFLAACGSDDDDSGSSGRVDRETDPSCLSAEQRANITTVLNRAANLRVITGTATGDWRNNDGTVVSSQEFEGSYTITQNDANSWDIREEFCNGGTDCQYNINHTARFEDGCFVWDGERADIDDDNSSTNLDFTINKSGVELNYDWVIPETGTIRLETDTEVAGQDLEWTFISTQPSI